MDDSPHRQEDCRQTTPQDVDSSTATVRFDKRADKRRIGQVENLAGRNHRGGGRALQDVYLSAGTDRCAG